MHASHLTEISNEFCSSYLVTFMERFMSLTRQSTNFCIPTGNKVVLFCTVYSFQHKPSERFVSGHASPFDKLLVLDDGMIISLFVWSWWLFPRLLV